MQLEDAVRAGLRLPVVRFAVVPVYLLGMALVFAARAPLVIGAVLVVAVLDAQGRLAPLVDAIAAIEPGDVVPGEPLPPELSAAVEGAVTPEAVGVFAAAATAAFLAWLVGQAAASAAGIHAIAAGLGVGPSAPAPSSGERSDDPDGAGDRDDGTGSPAAAGSATTAAGAADADGETGDDTTVEDATVDDATGGDAGADDEEWRFSLDDLEGEPDDGSGGGERTSGDERGGPGTRAGLNNVADGRSARRPGPPPDADPAAAAVRGVGADTWTFVGLAIARGAAGIGIPAAALALLGVLPALPGSLLVLLAVPGGPLLYFALGFAEQVAVVDDERALPALRGSLAFVRGNLDAFVGYLGVGFLALVAVLVIGMVLTAAGASAALTTVSLLLAPLAFDGFKTSLYAGRRAPEHPRGAASGADATGPPGRVPTGATARLRAGLRRGLAAAGRFPVAHPVACLAAAGLLLGGGLAGYRFTARFGQRLLAGGATDVAVDPLLAGQLFANNVTVAATTAFGGVAAGVPAITTMLLNGVFIGAIAGVVDPTAFLVLVAPHGVLELPAIAVAGGLGLVLGRRALAAAAGRRDAGTLGGDLRWAFDVVVGLAVVLAVAALIEAVVTPLVANAVL